MEVAFHHCTGVEITTVDMTDIGSTCVVMKVFQHPANIDKPRETEITFYDLPIEVCRKLAAAMK